MLSVEIGVGVDVAVGVGLSPTVGLEVGSGALEDWVGLGRVPGTALDDATVGEEPSAVGVGGPSWSPHPARARPSRRATATGRLMRGIIGHAKASRRPFAWNGLVRE